MPRCQYDSLYLCFFIDISSNFTDVCFIEHVVFDTEHIDLCFFVF